MDEAKEPSKRTLEAAPLLSIEPMNHKNAKGYPIDLFETLSTMLADPIHLQWISNATCADTDIKKFAELA